MDCLYAILLNNLSLFFFNITILKFFNLNNLFFRFNNLAINILGRNFFLNCNFIFSFFIINHMPMYLWPMILTLNNIYYWSFLSNNFSLRIFYCKSLYYSWWTRLIFSYFLFPSYYITILIFNNLYLFLYLLIIF
jgi:hypothetical protein